MAVCGSIRDGELTLVKSRYTFPVLRAGKPAKLDLTVLGKRLV